MHSYLTELFFKIRKFAEQHKTCILCSVMFSENGTVIRKIVQLCTDRQTVESNVTGCVVIAYWIIKCTDTNWYGD